MKRKLNGVHFLRKKAYAKEVESQIESNTVK